MRTAESEFRSLLDKVIDKVEHSEVENERVKAKIESLNVTKSEPESTSLIAKWRLFK